MKVFILDKKVRRNIALLRHLLRLDAERREPFFQVAQKTYQVLLNCHTGEMRLEEGRGDQGKEWRLVAIQLKPADEGAFEVSAPSEQACFHSSLLEKEALSTLSKTIHLLNELAYDPKQGKNPLWILRHISHLELEGGKMGNRSVMELAFHPVNRIKAEKLLLEAPVGAYLIRKDEWSGILEGILRGIRGVSIECVTLTYKDTAISIKEQILVSCKGKWWIYNDDLDLMGESYPTLEKLIESLSELDEPLGKG